MNMLLISSLLASLISVVLIVIILFYGKTRLHRAWAFYSGAVAIWGIGCFMAAKLFLLQKLC